MTALPRTLEWIGDGPDGFLRLLDQTRLPGEIVYRDCRTVEDVWEAIRNLRVRGAPAIGVAAAYGLVLAGQKFPFTSFDRDGFCRCIRDASEYLGTSRPTAINLFWALDRMQKGMDERPTHVLAQMWRTDQLAQALDIHEEDRAVCQMIGRHGATLVPKNGGVLTHCNAGGLATSEFGTALGVLYAAAEDGKQFHVYVDETRPLLQGARLTAWELQQHGIECTLICDSMAGQVMREGRVQLVIVGADRIAANGDTANKIGTYSVAVLAHAHGIPFYVAAPSSTFDLSIATGEQIPIEQRDPREVTHGFGSATAPAGIAVYNPAFDVTPARLIAGFITERGVIYSFGEGSRFAFPY
jgi:methylthioribose-1-phosphate isomerase